jgi:GT2 family glycosyltransferase
MREWDHASDREVDQVMGAFFMTRSVLFSALGGFDERFFVYFEEVDFSYRAHLAGWRSMYLSDVRAYHKGGGTSEMAKANRLFYSLRSRILYSYKHFTWSSATAVLIVTAVIEPAARIVMAGVRMSLAEIRDTIRGYGLFLHDLPRILAARAIR